MDILCIRAFGFPRKWITCSIVSAALIEGLLVVMFFGKHCFLNLAVSVVSVQPPLVAVV